MDIRPHLPLTQSLLTAVLLSMLGACASVDKTAMLSSFDDQTGETLTHPAAPVILATSRPGLSTVGKDYLSFSPVTVSGRGAPVTYLWLALSSTIDRGITGAETPGMSSIVLLVDDVPMTLEIEPWETAARSVPFDAPAETRTYAARVTNSQLQKIVDAAGLRALVVTPGAHAMPYALNADTRDLWGTVFTNPEYVARRMD